MKFNMKSVSFVLIPAFVFFFYFYKGEPVSALNQNHQCDNCHQMHSAAGGDPLLPEIDAENTCLTCHSPGGSSSIVASTHAGNTCVDCHDPHDNVPNWLGGVNIKMVLGEVGGSDGVLRPVVFESRGTGAGQPVLHSFCDGDADGNGVYDGVCDTCHMSTRLHIGYPTPSKHTHQRGTTCTNSTGCHPHMNDFRKL